MPDVHDRIRDFWDRDAHTYDASPSHAVSNPLEAATWRAAIRGALPDPPASVLDVGAGTGALSLLAAELGYDVTALDLSEAMLAKAREKARARGLEAAFVVGSAMQPPGGPFDIVMERHLLWTLPDPVRALRGWHAAVRPAGRLALFEGIWEPDAPGASVKRAGAGLLRRAMRIPRDHHAPYPEEVLAVLPLAGIPSPVPLINAVYEAGWTGVRIDRLRGVEWAAKLSAPWPLGRLEERARYVLVADA